MTPGVQASRLILDALNLPVDMTGMRVLDIGPADGLYSFECERRG
jgi:tRNA (mo5U34)-methyltransferase